MNNICACYRAFAHMWRHQYHWMPLWRKGEQTVKQPVFVSDVAAGIVAACTDRDAVGQTYQAVGSVFLTVYLRTCNCKPIPFPTCLVYLITD